VSKEKVRDADVYSLHEAA